MKNLILVRHAKSDHSVEGIKDFERGLNEQGNREAPRMAYLVAEKNIKIDALVASTADRPKLTAEYFAEKLGFDTESITWNKNIYEASVRILMNEFTLFDESWNTVMVVGHNPGLSYFAEYLTKEAIGDMPTCAVMQLSIDISSWQELSQGLGKIVFYEFPNQD